MPRAPTVAGPGIRPRTCDCRSCSVSGGTVCDVDASVPCGATGHVWLLSPETDVASAAEEPTC